jgi:hypothetical protein
MSDNILNYAGPPNRKPFRITRRTVTAIALAALLMGIVLLILHLRARAERRVLQAQMWSSTVLRIVRSDRRAGNVSPYDGVWFDTRNPGDGTVVVRGTVATSDDLDDLHAKINVIGVSVPVEWAVDVAAPRAASGPTTLMSP